MPKAISKNLDFILPGDLSWDDFSEPKFKDVEKKENWSNGVCAWAMLSPYQIAFRRFDSIKAGVLWMRDYGRDKGWSNHGGQPYIDFYPACGSCTQDSNYHHFPNGIPVRYVVGPRGGISKRKPKNIKWNA